MTNMDIEFQDVLKVDLALVGVGLLSKTDEVDALAAEMRADMNYTASGPSPVPEESSSLAMQLTQLPRDRISIQTIPDRTILRRDYPLGSGDLERLAEAVACAVEATGAGSGQLRAFGFNVT